MSAFSGSPRVAYHGYADFLLGHSPAPVPTVYGEGLAEIFSSFRAVDGSVRGDVPAKAGWSACRRAPLEASLEHLR